MSDHSLFVLRAKTNVFVCVFVCMYVCVCFDGGGRACMQVCGYACAHTYACVYMCSRVSEHLRACVCLRFNTSTSAHRKCFQCKKKKKKSETELTASVLKKRSKTHKRLKERFLIRRNRTKRSNFRGSPLFQATDNNTTENS